MVPLHRLGCTQNTVWVHYYIHKNNNETETEKQEKPTQPNTQKNEYMSYILPSTTTPNKEHPVPAGAYALSTPRRYR